METLIEIVALLPCLLAFWGLGYLAWTYVHIDKRPRRRHSGEGDMPGNTRTGFDDVHL